MAQSSKKAVGQLGEDIAARFLQAKGFKIVARNYWQPWGEIDIIAEKKGVVRFVEVKTVSRESVDDISRETDNYRPEENVHASKLAKVARTAELYMVHVKDTRDFQIDVVGVILDMKRKIGKCRLYEQVL